MIEGRLNGLKCVSTATVCPSQFDPQVVIEPDYVISIGGGRFYYITNMDRNTKMRYVLSKIRVEGALSAGKTSIRAEKLWVKRGKGFDLVWTADRHKAVTQTAPVPLFQQDQ